MSAPGTIEQLRDPDLDPLLDGIRARYIPLFENKKIFSHNICPGYAIGRAATKKFFDNFRHFMSLFDRVNTYMEWKGPPGNAHRCQRSRRSTTK